MQPIEIEQRAFGTRDPNSQPPALGLADGAAHRIRETSLYRLTTLGQIEPMGVKRARWGGQLWSDATTEFQVLPATLSSELCEISYNLGS